MAIPSSVILPLLVFSVIFILFVSSLRSKIKQDGWLITLFGASLMLSSIGLVVSGYMIGATLVAISVVGWVTVFPTIKHLLILKPSDKNRKIALIVISFICLSMGMIYLFLSDCLYAGVALFGIFTFGWYAVFPTIQHSLTLKPVDKNQIITLSVISFILYSIGTIYLFIPFAGELDRLTTSNTVKWFWLTGSGLLIFAFGFLFLLYQKYKEGYEEGSIGR